MRRRNGLIIIWILALLAGLLSGCGDTPAAQPEASATLPSLNPGAEESWNPEQGQNFPDGPAYTLPDANPDQEIDFGETPTAAPTSDLPVFDPEDPFSSGIPGIDSPEDYPEPLDTDLQPYLPDFPIRPDESDPEASDPDRPGKTDPAEAPDSTALRELLEEALADLDGVWSVYVKNVDTGETVCIHDEPMTAASLIKLFVAGAYYTTDPTVRNRDRCEKVDQMIRASSNDACNALIDYLGKDTINAFIRLSGFRDTVLNRKMLEQTDRENYTSTRECGQVLESILLGEYVSEEASTRLLENLKQQERTGKLPAGVPEGVETANKTGELTTVENDACIVWSEGGAYILCVMSQELTDVTAARKAIVGISELVYNYFNDPSDPEDPAPITGR